MYNTFYTASQGQRELEKTSSGTAAAPLDVKARMFSYIFYRVLFVVLIYRKLEPNADDV